MARKRLPQRNNNLHHSAKNKKVLLPLTCLLMGLVLVFVIISLSFNGQRQITDSPEKVYSTQGSAEQEALDKDLKSYAVTRVIDGDTFEIEIPNYGIDRIRVKNIDTPEIRRAKCERERMLANQAKNLASSLLGNEKVKLQADRKRDQFGRTIALVTLPDGRDLGAVLLASGIAVEWPNDFDWCN